MNSYPTMTLYESMAKHPEIKPVFDLLALVEPVDEFSRSLCLVRDCFAVNDTLRILSRRRLQGLMKERLSLMTAYETAVMQAATDLGKKPKSFMQAAAALPMGMFEEIRASFGRQVDELMSRPLEN